MVVIEDKIIRYRNNIELAKRLATHEYADRTYYEEIVFSLERVLKFYERLKGWREIS